MTKDRRQGVGVPGEGISLRGLDGWGREGGGRLGESESYSVNQKWRGAEGVAWVNQNPTR